MVSSIKKNIQILFEKDYAIKRKFKKIIKEKHSAYKSRFVLIVKEKKKK